MMHQFMVIPVRSEVLGVVGLREFVACWIPSVRRGWVVALWSGTTDSDPLIQECGTRGFVTVFLEVVSLKS